MQGLCRTYEMVQATLARTWRDHWRKPGPLSIFRGRSTQRDVQQQNPKIILQGLSIKPEDEEERGIGIKRRKRNWNVPLRVAKNLHDVLHKNEMCLNTLFRNGHFEKQHTKNPDESIQDLEKLTIDELKVIFNKVISSQKPNQQIITLIQNELIRRIQSLSVTDMLYFADGLLCSVLYISESGNISEIQSLYESRCEKYRRYMIHALRSDWDNYSVNVANGLQLLYYAGFSRNAPVDFLCKLEDLFLGQCRYLTSDELGLLCHSFFTVNHSIRSIELLGDIANAVLEKLPEMNLPMIANVMKVMRHARYENFEFYEHLGQNLLNNSHFQQCDISKDLTSITHIAVTFAAVRYIHEPFFEAVKSKLQSQCSDSRSIGERRIKDLTRILSAFAYLGHPVPENVATSLLNKLRKDKTHEFEFPESMVEALYVLAVAGVVDMELCKRVFTKRFLRIKKASHLEQHQQFHVLKHMYSLNFPKEELPLHLLSYCEKNPITATEHVCKALKKKDGFGCVLLGLEDLLGGRQFVKVGSITNFTYIPDMEFALDSNMHPVALPQSYDAEIECERGVVMEKLTRNHDIQASSFDDGKVGPLVAEIMQPISWTAEPVESLFIPAKDDKCTPSDQWSSEQVIHKVNIKMYGLMQYAVNKPSLLGRHKLELQIQSMMGYHIFLISLLEAEKIGKMTRQEVSQYLQAGVLDKLHQHLSKRT